MPAADPGQARACLSESRELSTALGYHNARDLVWAAGITFLVRDWAATLELGRSAIRGLQRGGDRIAVGFVLYIIAGALAAAQPEAAAIIQGAAETNMVESPIFAQRISSTVTETLGNERGRELRARGADMDWDQALAYTLTQITQALSRIRIRDPAMSGLPTGTVTLIDRRPARTGGLGSNIHVREPGLSGDFGPHLLANLAHHRTDNLCVTSTPIRRPARCKYSAGRVWVVLLARLPRW